MDDRVSEPHSAAEGCDSLRRARLRGRGQGVQASLGRHRRPAGGRDGADPGRRRGAGAGRSDRGDRADRRSGPHVAGRRPLRARRTHARPRREARRRHARTDREPHRDDAVRVSPADSAGPDLRLPAQRASSDDGARDREPPGARARSERDRDARAGRAVRHRAADRADGTAPAGRGQGSCPRDGVEARRRRCRPSTRRPAVSRRSPTS